MSNPPFTVKSVFEYASGHDDDLSFPIGQVLTVTAVEDAEWYYGEYTDGAGDKQEGIFPKNFVERYEPPAPPRPARPNRAKKEAEPVPVESPTAVSEPRPEAEPEVAEQSVENGQHTAAQQPPPPKSPPVASSPAVELPSSPLQTVTAPALTTATAPPPVKASSKPPPPAVAEKPSGSSFKDRIAAFNKPAAAPVAPLKPSGSNSSSFIRKQFVAPPPSKDSFVPPAREPPPKIYKREEDPEVREQLAREPPVSESRPPPPPPQQETAEVGAEDQPKPTSLKDRIALLQKQQLEQAQRHAEAAQKKEKPKPPRKSLDQPAESAAAVPGNEPESSAEASGSARDPSVDTVRAKAPPVLAAPFSPAEEIASDANDADYSAAADSEDAAETSSSKDDDEEPSEKPSTHAVEYKGEEADEEDEEEEEEEEMDPETRRRMELRDRMAKMSGGMGMMGLFGPPGGMPGMSAPTARKPKTPGDSEKKLGEQEPNSPGHAPPVPMVPLPGMNINTKPVPPPADVEHEDEEPLTTPITEQHASRDVPDVEEVVHDGAPPALPRRSTDRPRPSTQDRSALASPPPESRPAPAPPVPVEQPASPPPVPAGRPAPQPRSPTSDESDDELSTHARPLSLSQPAGGPPPVPASALPDHIDTRRSSTYDSAPPVPTPAAEKRASRPPPPIPSILPVSPPQGRAAPPPPPAHIHRRSTGDSRGSTMSATRQAGEDVEGEVTEYDGDYDTDIAPGAKFKDALRSHERDSSFDEGTMTDDHSLQSPRTPLELRQPPPIPSTAPRGAPPPPPMQPPRNARASMDTPRGPPPPPPNQAPSRNGDGEEYDNGDGEEYDPFNYAAPQHGLPGPPPPPPPQPVTEEYNDLYNPSPVQTPSSERPPTSQHERKASLAPPPPLTQSSAMPSPSTTRSQRASMDMLRGASVRRSMDVSRPSIDQGYIAADVDLAETTRWWTQPNALPPAFQNRKDILFEVEESTSPNSGGMKTVSKEVYVLFIDYSQTIVTVQFDAKNPMNATLEQRHEPPPLQLRQDQLEQAHLQLGTRISNSVNAVQNTTVADGTPFGLVQHLLNPLSDALLPVGTRAYGALVYSNLANASVIQNDEIRAGDIVSFRNARFQGHRGTMHQKYSAEVGKPDHVGIVVDWDGTKKKIRAWEQGRESKKVKMESFKLNDMRSGECKVWRVMPRSWVGWGSSK